MSGAAWHWQVKLCDPSLTRAIPERYEFLIIKCYTNLRLLDFQQVRKVSVAVSKHYANLIFNEHGIGLNSTGCGSITETCC